MKIFDLKNLSIFDKRFIKILIHFQLRKNPLDVFLFGKFKKKKTVKEIMFYSNFRSVMTAIIRCTW